MLRVEVIGLEPPCDKCTELLANAKTAVEELGIQAQVVKMWVLAPEVLQKYGLVLSPALAIADTLVAQGKVLKPETIADLLGGR
ncbi:MAG: thioredoxin family protein [Thermodesulfobacteriota bacterium]